MRADLWYWVTTTVFRLTVGSHRQEMSFVKYTSPANTLITEPSILPVSHQTWSISNILHRDEVLVPAGTTGSLEQNPSQGQMLGILTFFLGRMPSCGTERHLEKGGAEGRGPWVGLDLKFSSYYCVWEKEAERQRGRENAGVWSVPSPGLQGLTSDFQVWAASSSTH